MGIICLLKTLSCEPLVLRALRSHADHWHVVDFKLHLEPRPSLVVWKGAGAGNSSNFLKKQLQLNCAHVHDDDLMSNLLNAELANPDTVNRTLT